MNYRQLRTLSYPSFLVFFLGFLGIWLQEVRAANQEVTSAAALTGVDLAEEEESKASGSLNVIQANVPFQLLPTDVHSAIAAYLSEQEVCRVICLCKAFDTLRTFVRQAEVGTLHPITYRLAVDGLEAWAKGPSYAGRKILYIHPCAAAEATQEENTEVDVYGCVAKRTKVVRAPYIESRVLQKKLTGLVIHSDDDKLKLAAPVYFPKLTRLQLHIRYFTYELLAHFNIGRCSHLEILDISGYGYMREEATDWLKGLTRLKILKLKECPWIPLTSKHCLPQLQVLWLDFCMNGDCETHEEFCSFLSQCRELKELKLHCLIWHTEEDAQAFLQQLGRLSQLKILLLYSAIAQGHGTLPPDLTRIDWQDFKNIEQLTLQNWMMGSRFEEWDTEEEKEALHTLNLSNLPRLVSIVFKECARLEYLVLEGLPHLQQLTCDYCGSLGYIVGLSHCPKLATLQLTHCHNLEWLNLGNHPLRALEELQCTDCEKLKRLSGLFRCKQLKTLKLVDCPSLSHLNLGERGIPNLQELVCEACRGLQHLAELDRCKHLKIIRVTWCCALTRLNLGKRGAPALHELDCTGCKQLQGIIGLSKAQNLTTLRLQNCQALESLSMLAGGAPCLRELDCTDCKALRDMSPLTLCKNLRVVNLAWCTLLDSAPEASIKVISSLPLEELNLTGWNSLTTVDQLAALAPTLRRLIVDRCDNLEDVSVLTHFKNLQAVSLDECPALNDRWTRGFITRLLERPALGEGSLEQMEDGVWLNNLD